MQYNSFGALTSASLGNGVSETRGYDARGRLQSISDGSVYTLSGMTYSGNGNVLTANDSVNGNWTYTYDDFNRLQTAGKSGQAFSYDYDRFGNRWHQNVTQGSGPNPNFTFDANNHIQGTPYLYDAAGNLLNDGAHTYTYDAENRIVGVDASSYTYDYDAASRRVRVVQSGGGRELLYDLFGNPPITEVWIDGSWWEGDYYAAGRRVVTYYYPGYPSLFPLSDWLGSERTTTYNTGSVFNTCTILPFGDALNCNPSVSSFVGIFTGKERDSESNLDYFGARYYGSSMGRFTSPDPITIKIDRLLIPQRLNLYSYVANNPLVSTDPDGRDIVSGTGDQKAIRIALKEIASHPGGREFLVKLDNVTAKIAVSTGKGLTDRNGNAAYGQTKVQPGSPTTIQRTTDSSGKITDVKSPNIETTVDFGLAKQDKKNGVDGAPQSNAELLGHELKHDEAQFFKLPNSESAATQGIDDILNTPTDKSLQKSADQFVDELLKPNQNNQQPEPPKEDDKKSPK